MKNAEKNCYLCFAFFGSLIHWYVIVRENFFITNVMNLWNVVNELDIIIS